MIRHDLAVLTQDTPHIGAEILQPTQIDDVPPEQNDTCRSVVFQPGGFVPTQNGTTQSDDQTLRRCAAVCVQRSHAVSNLASG